VAELPRVELPAKIKELFGDPDDPSRRTGTDFLSEQVLERAKKGSFVEKVRCCPY
jgi:hypothetical protein